MSETVRRVQPRSVLHCLLAERGALLSEPYTKQLDGKVRELRFHQGRRAMRISYWIAPGRRIILLTIFAKIRGWEIA